MSQTVKFKIDGGGYSCVYIGLIKDRREVAVKKILILGENETTENVKKITNLIIENEIMNVQVADMIAFLVLTKDEHPFGLKINLMQNIQGENSINLGKYGVRKAQKLVLWLIKHKSMIDLMLKNHWGILSLIEFVYGDKTNTEK